MDLPDVLIGCKVFPLQPGTKDPATRHGFADATNDAATIAQWEALNPDFNWAVACGLSGLFVFDIDPAGLEWWAEFVASDPAIKAAVDAAFTVRTPKGGLHVYFKGEGPTSASKIAAGVDTRGGFWRDEKLVSGGYVVLPGSRTKAGPGRVDGGYVVVNDGVIRPMPTALQGVVPARKKTETKGLEKDPAKDLPRNIKTARDLLNRYVESGHVAIEGQGGDDRTFQVVASILDKGISPGTAYELLQEIWNPHCVPPWDGADLEKKIENALAHGEDTQSGAKGFQANADAFARFAGMETEAPKSARHRSRIMPLHDYADSADDPTWLIPGVIPARGIGMFYGQSGSYKSFLALDMALTLAFGIPGQWSAPPVKNDVLFLAGEGSIATARKRWPAWMDFQQLEFRNDHRFFIKDNVPFFTDKEAWENVKIDLAELDVKPSLIVIDTLARLMTGMDENTSKDATLVTTFLEDLARYYECFVLVIHHEGKDKNRGARGSSAWQANMDMVLSTKKRQDGAEFRIIKQKDADVPDHGFYFKLGAHKDSVVLERTEQVLQDEQERGKSRFDWASVEEVTRVLQSNQGEMSHRLLVQTIAAANGLQDNPDAVRRQLKSEALKFLRDGDKWRIPGQEFDL